MKTGLGLAANWGEGSLSQLAFVKEEVKVAFLKCLISLSRRYLITYLSVTVSYASRCLLFDQILADPRL
jgi:hypothetical protein